MLLPAASLSLPRARSDWIVPLPLVSRTMGIVYSTMSDSADSCFDWSVAGPGSYHVFA